MHVFISRLLSSHSVFAQKMSENNITLTAKSLIQFSACPFDAPTTADWIFFYSKNGVKYYFDQISATTKKYRIACLGPGTANELLLKTGIQADFVGSGAPKETAEAFRALALNKTVAFIQASNSNKSVQQQLSETTNILSCIVYTNTAIAESFSFLGQVLVFTSPLNAKTYFAQNTINLKQEIIAIGNSTADALEKIGVSNIAIANEPTEAAMAEAVLKLIV